MKHHRAILIVVGTPFLVLLLYVAKIHYSRTKEKKKLSSTYSTIVHPSWSKRIEFSCTYRHDAGAAGNTYLSLVDIRKITPPHTIASAKEFYSATLNLHDFPSIYLFERKKALEYGIDFDREAASAKQLIVINIVSFEDDR